MLKSNVHRIYLVIPNYRVKASCYGWLAPARFTAHGPLDFIILSDTVKVSLVEFLMVNIKNKHGFGALSKPNAGQAPQLLEL